MAQHRFIAAAAPFQRCVVAAGIDPARPALMTNARRRADLRAAACCGGGLFGGLPAFASRAGLCQGWRCRLRSAGRGLPRVAARPGRLLRYFFDDMVGNLPVVVFAVRFGIIDSGFDVFQLFAVHHEPAEDCFLVNQDKIDSRRSPINFFNCS